MTIHDKIKDEKLQYDFDREAAKISAASSRKIDTYEYLTGEAIIPSDQSRTIEQAKFKHFPLAKAFEKQIKTRKKTSCSFRVLKPEDNKEEIKSV